MIYCLSPLPCRKRKMDNVDLSIIARRMAAAKALEDQAWLQLLDVIAVVERTAPLAEQKLLAESLAEYSRCRIG